MEPIVRAILEACARSRRNIAAIWLVLTVLLPAPAVSAQDDADSDAATEATVPATETSEDNSEYAGPKITAAERKSWVQQQHRTKYTNALRKLDKEEIDLGVRYHLYGLTMEEYRDDNYEEFGDSLPDLVRKFLKELESPVVSAESRAYANQQVVEVAQELLDQPPEVRINVCILVSSLNVKNAGPRGEPAVPYIPSIDFHSAVLRNPSQLVSCKIWAAIGMGRIGRDAQPSVTERSQIANDLAAALVAPDAAGEDHMWYRMRLVESLGYSGLTHDVTRQPVVIDSLMRVLIDPQEHWVVRATAARSIPQLPLESKTEIPLICYEIGRLTQQMAQARNQNLKSPYWKYCFLNVYMAFQSRTEEEQEKKWGLLNQVTKPALRQHAANVQSLYEAILPIVNSVTQTVEPAATPASDIEGLGEWIQNNVPQNWKVTPESDELKRPTEDEQATMADTGSGEAATTSGE